MPEDSLLEGWAVAPHKPLAGQVVFFETGVRVPRETIAFAAGHCVFYGDEFESGHAGAGAYVARLRIAATAFELRAGGPAGALAAAVAGWAGAVGEAPTPGLVSTPLPTDGWLADLETVLGPAAGVRTLVATWVAGGLDEQKLKSAIENRIDKKEIFEQLRDAKKGIFEHRVIIDDYKAIPGVSELPFNGGNSLPKKALKANDFLSNDEKEELARTNKFGIDNEQLNLPDYRAATFTETATLIKLKPGTPLYRVTDPGGEGGPWWTLEPPKDLAEVIGGTAVMPEWNGFNIVIKAVVPDDEQPFYVWSGKASAQEVSLIYEDKKNNGFHLAGETEQVFLPNPTKDNAGFKKSFTDKSAKLKKW